MRRNPTKSRGFSLIELVIVVVIIGIIAAIAIPRMSRGSAGAADSALSGDMAVWRSAIDLYYTEHSNNWPTDNTTIAAQLTSYTDANGSTVSKPDSTHIYGPYMRTIPALPVSGASGSGVPKGSNSVGATTGAPTSITTADGWLYDKATGTIYPNTGAVTDTSGKAYTSY